MRDTAVATEEVFPWRGSIVRNATAVWVGAGKDGGGTLTTQSGTLDEAPYSFAKRFGEEKGTNRKN